MSLSTNDSSVEAAGIFVTEYVVTIVSRSQGMVRAASAQPPHRSTTSSLPRWTATAAPVSVPSASSCEKRSRTSANAGSTVPASGGLVMRRPLETTVGEHREARPGGGN